ncbi:MAG: hypothetical protein WBO17_03570 [Sphingorhabdus sp.]
MFIGHYAPALVAATLPRAPRLGLLFVGAQLVDIAFFGFVLGGIESMRITPGITRMNGLDLYDMPYTHSLVGGIIWGGLAIIIFQQLTRNLAGALILGGVVVSHWCADLLVHRPDLTLAGTPPALGLGLWNYPMIEMPFELGLVGASLGFYLRRTRHVVGMPTYWPWALGVVMFSIQIYNWFSPEPEALTQSLPLSALFAFALLAWLAHKTAQTRMLKGAGEN